RRAAERRMRIDAEAPVLEQLQVFAVGLPRAWLRLAPGIGEEAQRSARRDIGIELAQGAGGGVARVGEGLLARRLLARVHLLERLALHVDLAAYVERPRDRIWHPAFELVRDVLHGAQVRRDILAGRAVAARRADRERAVLVAQADRQAVDLGLARE